MNSIIKTYTELKSIDSFEKRLIYLKLTNRIGEETFGRERYINQNFYASDEWKQLRDEIIIRDKACDLGFEGCEIKGSIYIHHMNPITEYDIINRTEFLLNPEFLICTSFITHNMIHYGSEINNSILTIERSPNDMCPWKRR